MCSSHLVLRLLLVALGGSGVLGLVHLVCGLHVSHLPQQERGGRNVKHTAKSVLRGAGAGRDVDVRVLGDLLVGLLGGTGGGLLDLVADVRGGVAGR